jgi:hypothetical protein
MLVFSNYWTWIKFKSNKKKPVKLEINFLIYQSQKKINFHLKNGIKKIIMFIEDTFLIM